MRFPILILLFFVGGLVHSEAPRRVPVVALPVAEVYLQPSFKARVVERMREGNKLTLVGRKVVGKDGFGVFFCIKLADGRIGYITDSDVTWVVVAPPAVVSTPAPAEDVAPLRVPAPPSSPTPSPVAENQPAVVRSLPPLLGLTLVSADEGEKLQTQPYHHARLFFGLRRTGGARSYSRMRTDFSLLFSPTPPGFLSGAGAFGKTSGYMVLSNFLFLFPIIASHEFSFYGGLGPSLGYSSYSTNLTTGPYTASQMHAGGDLDLGLSFGALDWAFRFDVKYTIEVASYLSEAFSCQWAF